MIHITQADPLGVEALRLLELAAQEARELYPELHPPGVPSPTNQPLPAKSVFLLAHVDDELAGCGALYPLEARAAEIKRVFVRRELRRKGIARSLMAELKGYASNFGYDLVRLETGFRQLPAIAMYERDREERASGL
jgi:putative acetyltransferase